jgi:cobalt-precorrin-6B (C15)-methyltransferase
MNRIWEYTTPGIPDELFIRGEVPMTKQEARCLTLAKLKLKDDLVIWDVGAGTGSISVESALQCKSGKVYAIERNVEAIALIKQNVEQFGIANIEVVPEAAPDGLCGLPSPDRVIVGGAGEQLLEVLDYTNTMLSPGGIIVTNCITIETVSETLAWFEKHNYIDIDAVCVSASRMKKMGSRHAFLATNPIYIVSGRKELIHEG